MRRCLSQVTTALLTLAAVTASMEASAVAAPQAPNANGEETSKQRPFGANQARQPYQAKSYSHLIGMKGFDNTLLNNHFKLYEGYVKQANLLQSELQRLLNEGKERTPEYAGLKHMFGWEFDGMRLHEYYFDNLGGNGKLDPNSALYNRLAAQFGSYDVWKKDFIATGLIRGIGWAILYEDPQTGRLVNVWINEHDLGHLAGGKPLLIMDVFEHAYITQYGLDRAKYIDAFFANIDWNAVDGRLN